ncbi:hypothetical protein ACJX0J_016236, partial [Zea mays]
IVWNLEEKIHILELNIGKPQEWHTLTKEEKNKVLDIEALDNLQRELICGPHFLHYITEIPDQELLHKAHFLILQSAKDVSNFVIGFKSGVKTRREAYKDDPFILAKGKEELLVLKILDLIKMRPCVPASPAFRCCRSFPIMFCINIYSLMSFPLVYIVFFDAANAYIVFEYNYVQWVLMLYSTHA